MPPNQQPWRPEQQHLLSMLKALRPEALGFLEGGTGIGKTRVACDWAIARARQGHPVLIAVPTVSLGTHWVSELQHLDSDLQIQPVWGQSHYPDPGLQQQAIDTARGASIVICTQHMIAKLAPLRTWHLIVDEAHLLVHALKATSGTWMPAAQLGTWFARWCESQMLVAGQTADWPLAGRMRQLIIQRLKLPDGASISASVTEEGNIGITVANPGDLKRHTHTMWSHITQGILMSATLSQRNSAGIRTVSAMATRLHIPSSRQQDLGVLRAPWRDAGVRILTPERTNSKDGKPWLSAHASRRETWWHEVAQVIATWQEQRAPTLLLTTSYEDALRIGEQAQQLGIKGVLVDSRELDRAKLKQAFEQGHGWCWIATGSAWTGMDISTPVQRLVIAKLPLVSAEQIKGLEDPASAHFDALARFQQGLGRLVRANLPDIRRELIILDGRVNEPGPWWRGVCLPYMRVLGELYEDHARLAPIGSEGGGADCSARKGATS